MKSAVRFDVGTLGALSRTPTGGLVVPANVTRIGVFPYRFADGTSRRELRPAEEVFAPASLESLTDVPITDRHPSDLVTADTYRELSRGHVRPGARPEGAFVVADLAVQDADLVGKIERGEAVENSCGYVCDFDPTPGVFDGEPYDVVQRNIRYNHVALGPRGWGRGGREVALRLDSEAAVIDDPTTRILPMKFRAPTINFLHAERAVRVDSVTFPLTKPADRSSAIDAIAASFRRSRESVRTDAVSAEMVAEIMSTFEQMTQQFMAFADAVASSTTQQDVIEVEGAAPPAPEPAPAEAPMDASAVPAPNPEEDPTKKMDAAIEARLAILDHARRIAPAATFDAKAKPRDTMLAALAATGSDVTRFDGRDDSFVEGAFFNASPAIDVGPREAVQSHRTRNDSAEPRDPAAVRAASRQATADAYKTPAKN